MEINVPIPKQIEERLREYDYNDKEIKAIFAEFIKTIMNNDYNQFFDDFDNWIEDSENEFLAKIDEEREK